MVPSYSPFGEIASAVTTWPGPAWLSEARTAAIGRFNAAGLPSTKLEAWRTTPLPNLGTDSFVADAISVAGSDPEGLVGAFTAQDAVTMVFVDGFHSATLSSPESAWPKGVRISPVSRILETTPDELRPSIEGTSGSHGTLWDLNTAAFRDGAFLEVEDFSQVEAEVRIIVIASSTDRPAARHLRNFIRLGRDASLRVLVAVIGQSSARGFTNQQTTIELHDRSRLDLVRVHESPIGAPHFDTATIAVGPHAVFNDTLLQTGASWTRSEIVVALKGDRGSADLGGVFVARGTQVSDIHTVVSHAAPGVTSRQNYRGLAADEGRGVFHGQIKVEADARGADATQGNKNMLLSKRAQVHSTPSLEILTDDVKCKHGSATGQIDPAQLFYLRSRGIDLQEATLILTRAFAGEILSRLTGADTRSVVEARIAPSLEQLGVAA